MAIVLRLKEASHLLSQGKYDHVLSILHEIRGLVGVDRYHAKKVLRDGFSREMKEPHPLSPLRLAMEHLRASDKDKACDVLKRAMEPMEECRQMRYYDPTVSDMLVMFGKVYITLGFGEEGQHFHRQALRGAYHYSLLHPSACSDSRVREMLRLLDLPGDTEGCSGMEESYGSYFHPLGSAVHPGEVLCGAGLAQGVARLAWGYVSNSPVGSLVAGWLACNNLGILYYFYY